MKINKIWTVAFSPTGNSKRVVSAIASGFQGTTVEHIDLTYPEAVTSKHFESKEIVVIGAPVYVGRVAPLAVKRLAGLVGDNTPAVLVVTYGNREFEDALVELKDLSLGAGFRPIAAGAFIGEHSFSGADTPIAAGRPDTGDLATARSFGVDINNKISELEKIESLSCPEIPGNHPYKEGMGQLPFTPLLREKLCTKCGLCLTACPTGAVALESAIELDRNLCIFCCSCIKTCPENALVIDAAPLKQKRQWLYEHCQAHKEAQLYL